MTNAKRILFFIFSGLLSGSVQFSYAQNAQPQVASRTQANGPSMSRAPVIVSPEILPDNSVIFRLLSKDATTVAVTGEFMDENADGNMIKDNDGLWTLKVGPLKPEFYKYSFIVNGVRNIDPSNPVVVRDEDRFNSVILVPGTGSELYGVRDVPHGIVLKVWYNSPTLGFNRRMSVYTPPGYESNDQKYPVLYLLHGAGADEDAWLSVGRAAVIMDNLIAQKKANPMIVVITNGNQDQPAAIAERPVQTDQNKNIYGVTELGNLKFCPSLVNDVIPYIESHYRVLKDRNNRAIAGLSMGALQVQFISISNPSLFGYTGIFSLGLHDNFGEVNNNLIKTYDANLKTLSSNYVLYYIGCGTDDFCYQGVKVLREKLDEHNFKYIYRETSGAHAWNNWRIYLAEFATLLFK